MRMSRLCVIVMFFFFQAEDGIRDSSVTGVQTCALPIWGNALAAQKRFDAAVASYEMAIARKPGYAAALINHGLALYELKRFDEALASYDQAIALRPGDTAAVTNPGHRFQAQEQFVSRGGGD